MQDLITTRETHLPWANTGDGAINLVADDVLLQAESEANYSTTLTQGGHKLEGPEGPVLVSPKLLLPAEIRGNTKCNVYLNGERLKVEASETYLGMTLTSTGLTEKKATRRVTSARLKVVALTHST